MTVAKNPIRVATAVLSERIFAGRPTKDGRGFKEPRYDVTSDVLVAIRDKVGIGNEIEVGLPGTAVEFRIAVLPPRPIGPETPSQTVSQDRAVEAAAKAHCDFFGGEGWWDSGFVTDTKPAALNAMRCALAAFKKSEVGHE
jgi:hypothetical protein